jgi:hypothetical protein
MDAEVNIHLWLRVYLLSSGHLFEGLIDLLQLIPANRPGLAVARWHVSSHSDDLHMEIFQEALVEPGLLEAIILSVILLRSGRSLGVVPAGASDVLMFSHTAGMGSYTS